jgi:hypothetical protein
MFGGTRGRRQLAVILVLAALLFSTQALAWTAPASSQSAGRPLQAVLRFLQPVDDNICSPARGPVQEENVVAGFEAAYLNQIALSPEGTRQCGVASAAMILAMRGAVPATYEAMSDKANQMWQGYADPTYVNRVVQMLGDHGVRVNSACLAGDEAWERLTAAVDCGAPSIVVSTRLTSSGSGHFLVAAGYSQENGRRQIIAYDPYGHWGGPEEGYHVNGTHPDSRGGERVAYDFDALWGYGSERCAGGYLLTIQP